MFRYHILNIHMFYSDIIILTNYSDIIFYRAKIILCACRILFVFLTCILSISLGLRKYSLESIALCIAVSALMNY